MDIFKKRIKPRWFLYFYYNKETIYEMNCSGAWRMLGYVSPHYSKKELKPGWEIILMFGEDRNYYRLKKGDFIAEDRPSQELSEIVERYDGGYTSKHFLEEVMYNKKTGVKIPNPSIQEMMQVSMKDRLRNMEEGIEEKETVTTVIGSLFQ